MEKITYFVDVSYDGKGYWIFFLKNQLNNISVFLEVLL